MGYTRTAIKGVSWLTSIRIITRVFSLAKTIAVARFLTPSQFGLFGIATLVLAFIEVITETGVNVFLVQQKDNIDKYLGTALSVSIVRGTVISIIIIISTPFIANFFNAPDARLLLYTMSAVPFLRGFINPAIVKFQKDLMFDKEFRLRTIAIAFEILSTVILLFLYPHPITLIWGILVGVVAEVALSYIMLSPRPKVAWDKKYVSKLFHTGKWITSAVVFNYGFERGDDIVVGRVLGTASLGIYDMAYRFSLLPITELVNMVTRVVFPVYVRISGDYERLKNAYFKTILAVTCVVMPFGILVFLFPQQIILLVLGEKWIAASEVLRVLAVLSILRAISLSFSGILLALKKQKNASIVSIISFLGMIFSIIPFVSMYGITGAAYSALLGYSLSVPFTIYFSLVALRAQRS